MATHELRDAYLQLELDAWRRGNPFSPDIAAVQAVLFDVYANRSDCETQVMRWMQRYQTCIFGKVAAATNSLHVALLTDQDIQTKSDEEVAAFLAAELLTWRRRCLRPSADFSTPGHGFVLVVASQRLAEAAPNYKLRRFADLIRSLWGCSSTNEPVGEVHWETLFLRHPTEQRFWKFTFSVDFFGSQGDGRWWHDHRSPGGLLFTANSVGHMRLYRELYEGKEADQAEWVMQSAMKTIDDAADTPWGPATWLKPLGPDGHPVVASIPCPFAQPVGLKAELSTRDWTRYGGYLHSDHSVRPEFFDPRAAPSGEILRREHLQDFTYLYDRRTRDHAKFMGVEVTAEEVHEALGAIETWTAMPRARAKEKGAKRGFAAPPAEPTLSGLAAGLEDRRRLETLIDATEAWELSPAEVELMA